MKDLLLRENFTSTFGRLRQNLRQKACRTCSTIIFLNLTNQIIDLGRCRGRCRRHFLTAKCLFSCMVLKSVEVLSTFVVLISSAEVL